MPTAVIGAHAFGRRRVLGVSIKVPRPKFTGAPSSKALSGAECSASIAGIEEATERPMTPAPVRAASVSLAGVRETFTEADMPPSGALDD
jgi:hypothetical protein